VSHKTRTVSRLVDGEIINTPNPHATCTGPTRPVGTLHNSANELLGKREGGGGTAESVSTPIEGQSDRTTTDRADDAKSMGDDPSDTARDSVDDEVVGEMRRDAPRCAEMRRLSLRWTDGAQEHTYHQHRELKKKINAAKQMSTTHLGTTQSHPYHPTSQHHDQSSP
jgi:hypothetical protein